MAEKSFVRLKSFRCNNGKGKARYFEQDVFLMPSFQPTQKRKKNSPARFADMDAKKLKAYQDHQKAQQDLNDARAVRYCKLLVETNFTLGDIIVHPTYSDEYLPESFEAAQKVMYNYVRKLKRMAKKKGQELKYVFVTEHGSVHGRLHHHLIVNASSGLTREEIENAWPYGYCDTQLNKESGWIAKYISKESRTYKGKHIYSASRNLIKPTVTTADNQVSKKKLRELTESSNEEIKAYFEKRNADYEVVGVYRYIPREEELEEEQAKLWRDGFSYLRVYMRLREDIKQKRRCTRC